jgi:hypothetical protein
LGTIRQEWRASVVIGTNGRRRLKHKRLSARMSVDEWEIAQNAA